MLHHRGLGDLELLQKYGAPGAGMNGRLIVAQLKDLTKLTTICELETPQPTSAGFGYGMP
jgi:hypothetical protein